jgi:ABC-type oligopeptide transport system substrate-binding subunit
VAWPFATAGPHGAAVRPTAVARTGSPALGLVAGALIGPAVARPPSGRRFAALLLAGALVFSLGAVSLSVRGRAAGTATPVPGGAATDTATLFVSRPVTLDPAVVGDVASAAVISQLFEGLTVFDSSLRLRPALASSWDVSDGGRRIVFHLRTGLRFSDGAAIHGADVVRSWLRLIRPGRNSPLAALMDGVTGAADYAAGRNPDPASVGVAADGDDVIVRLSQPAGEFPAIVASPSFAVTPPGIETGIALAPATFVASGGYVLTSVDGSSLVLTANTAYWAGTPAIRTVRLLTSLQGRSPVTEFEAGLVDRTPIGDADASWIAYDRILGPSLRRVPSLGVTYYGFDTTRPPFNDVRVRRAFAMAVDWTRLATLAGPITTIPANSMIPAGVPGHPSRDFSPPYDPARARAALAEAGFAGGAGFPRVALVTGGSRLDEAIAAQIRTNLGIDLALETVDTLDLTAANPDPPAFWDQTWVADYPGANDFLGVLLGSGQSNNYGRWSSPEFDQAIADAGAATDEAAVAAALERAQSIVQSDAPVIPVSYSSGWALSRAGLLGAGENGLGLARLAGLAWAKP